MTKQRDLFSSRPQTTIVRPKVSALDEKLNFNASGEPRTAPTLSGAVTVKRVLAPDPGAGTIKAGATGEQVVQLQEALVEIEFMSAADAFAEHGIFGKRTEEAVEKLEVAAHLQKSGRYDSYLFRPLKEFLKEKWDAKKPLVVPAVPAFKAEVATSLPNLTLNLGDTGASVVALQAALVKAEMLSEADVIGDNGKFGQNTEEAIRGIEVLYNAQPTGRYDNFVRRALGEILAGEIGKSAFGKDPASGWVVASKPAPKETKKGPEQAALLQWPSSSKPTPVEKDAKPYVRRTSAKAFKAIVDEGTVGRMQKKVYAALYQSGPLTAGELNQACLEEGQVTPGYHKRLSELERMGVVRRVGVRECKVSKRDCETWDVTDSMPSKPKANFQRTHTIFAVGVSPEGALRALCDMLGYQPKLGSITDLEKLPAGLTWSKSFYDEATKGDMTVGGCEVPGGFTLTYMK